MSTNKIQAVSEEQVATKTKKGVKWSALQIITRNVVSLGVTAVLARILAPSDYGLIGMVTVLTALLQVFSDMGLSWATIQRKHLTSPQVSNLFWINTLVGCLLSGLCWVLSGFVVEFYDVQELKDITIVLGITFILAGITAQPIALLNRQMDFKAIAKIEVFSILFGAIVGLIMAYNGAGYWALVYQTIANQAVRAVLSFHISRIAIIKPTFGVGTFQLVAFGGTLAINGLLIYAARNLDSILIGKYWGAEQLGLYNRAYFLMLLPSMLATGVLSSLMVPSLSALQDNKMKLYNAYSKALKMVALVGCPLALGLGLSSEEIVYIIYGEKWGAVVPLINWLIIASITQPLFNTTGWLFTATGNAKKYLWLTVISGVLLSISFFLSVPYGVGALAAAYGGMMGVIIFIPSMWYSHKIASFDFNQSVRKLLPIFFSLVVMGSSVMLVDLITEVESYSKFAIKVAVGVLSYGISITLFDRSLVNELKNMLKK